MEFEGWTTIQNNTLSERIDETQTEVIQYQDYGINTGYQVSSLGLKNQINFYLKSIRKKSNVLHDLQLAQFWWYFQLQVTVGANRGLIRGS